MKDYAIDGIDERDYNIETLLGAVEDLPSKVVLEDDEIQNQRFTDPRGCVFFAGSSISNTMNYISNDSTRISGTNLCKIAIEKGYLNPKAGAWIQKSPILLKELGYITAYGLCVTLNDIKLSLFHKKPVQTGTKTINWTKTKQNNNIAVRGTSYGHSFFICGYDDEKQLLKCENSYSENSYDNGYFYIKYSDLDLLFGARYTMVDKVNAETIYKEKVRANIGLEEAKKMFDLNFWNGLNPKKAMSRQEVMTVLYRLYERINK